MKDATQRKTVRSSKSHDAEEKVQSQRELMLVQELTVKELRSAQGGQAGSRHTGSGAYPFCSDKCIIGDKVRR